MATRCKTKYKARRGGLNPTNAVSRISVAILGVFLDPVYQRLENPTDHAIQNHVCCQGGICTSGALGSLSPLTGQQMIKRVQAASAPQGFQIGYFDANLTNLTFLETVGVKQLFGFFIFNIWLF